MTLEDDLTAAAATGNTADVEYLLRAGAEVNGVNCFGRTALQVSVDRRTSVCFTDTVNISNQVLMTTIIAHIGQSFLDIVSLFAAKTTHRKMTRSRLSLCGFSDQTSAYLYREKHYPAFLWR